MWRRLAGDKACASAIEGSMLVRDILEFIRRSGRSRRRQMTSAAVLLWAMAKSSDKTRLQLRRLGAPAVLLAMLDGSPVEQQGRLCG